MAKYHVLKDNGDYVTLSSYLGMDQQQYQKVSKQMKANKQQTISEQEIILILSTNGFDRLTKYFVMLDNGKLVSLKNYAPTLSMYERIKRVMQDLEMSSISELGYKTCIELSDQTQQSRINYWIVTPDDTKISLHDYATTQRAYHQIHYRMIRDGQNEITEEMAVAYLAEGLFTLGMKEPIYHEEVDGELVPVVAKYQPDAYSKILKQLAKTGQQIIPVAQSMPIIDKQINRKAVYTVILENGKRVCLLKYCDGNTTSLYDMICQMMAFNKISEITEAELKVWIKEKQHYDETYSRNQKYFVMVNDEPVRLSTKCDGKREYSAVSTRMRMLGKTSITEAELKQMISEIKNTNQGPKYYVILEDGSRQSLRTYIDNQNEYNRIKNKLLERDITFINEADLKLVMDECRLKYYVVLEDGQKVILNQLCTDHLEYRRVVQKMNNRNITEVTHDELMILKQKDTKLSQKYYILIDSEKVLLSTFMGGMTPLYRYVARQLKSQSCTEISLMQLNGCILTYQPRKQKDKDVFIKKDDQLLNVNDLDLNLIEKYVIISIVQLKESNYIEYQEFIDTINRFKGIEKIGGITMTEAKKQEVTVDEMAVPRSIEELARFTAITNDRLSLPSIMEEFEYANIISLVQNENVTMEARETIEDFMDWFAVPFAYPTTNYFRINQRLAAMSKKPKIVEKFNFANDGSFEDRKKIIEYLITDSSKDDRYDIKVNGFELSLADKLENQTLTMGTGINAFAKQYAFQQIPLELNTFPQREMDQTMELIMTELFNRSNLSVDYLFDADPIAAFQVLVDDYGFEEATTIYICLDKLHKGITKRDTFVMDRGQVTSGVIELDKKLRSLQSALATVIKTQYARRR